MMKKVIIIGAGGHGKVLTDIILKSNDVIIGFLDDGVEVGTKILGYPVLGKSEEALKYKDDHEFVIAIGSQKIREMIATKYDLSWYTAIHPTASIATDVTIDQGTVVMAYAIVNTSTKIGKHCIINSGVIVEHDNVIEDYAHLSPNTTLCGAVTIGKSTHIGASATVINNIEITSDCIIGAGSVVINDIIEKGTYVGVPARRIK